MNSEKELIFFQRNERKKKSLCNLFPNWAKLTEKWCSLWWLCLWLTNQMKTFSIQHLLCKFCCKHQQLYTKKTQRNFPLKQKCATHEQVKMWWRKVWCLCLCCKLNPCQPSPNIQYFVLFPNSCGFRSWTLFLWESYYLAFMYIMIG